MKFARTCVFLGAGLLPLSLAAQPRLAQTFLTAPGKTGPLKGTLLAPAAKPGAALLIIPGSGPTDRDGNNPLGVKASTYQLLAEGLAARGTATLRIDKRGMFASAAAARDANAVTIPDYVDDVRSWVTVLAQDTGAPCVWLLGHSEGGLIAMAAARELPGVCGLVLVATAGRPMGEVLREQLKANPANAALVDKASSTIDALEQGRRVDTQDMPEALRRLFRAPVQGFLISAFSYDPQKLLEGYAKPVLVLQGQRDIQVGEPDARLLHKADPAATLVLLPAVNHVLKTVASDDRQENIATYADPALPLAPGVVDAIAGFLAGHGAAPGK